VKEGASGRRRKNSIGSIKRLVRECTDEDRSEWATDTRTVLDALHRARHSRKTEVRQAIAGSFLEIAVAASGWNLRKTPASTLPYGVVIEKNGRLVRIATVAPQWNTKKAKRVNPADYERGLHVFEFQKKPQKTKADGSIAPESDEAVALRHASAPFYHYAEFDVLAVNLHGITRRWTDFRYTLSSWLRPDEDNSSFINIAQSVSLPPTETWTDNLSICLEWNLIAQEGKQRTR
jgi:hypothetical protein